MTVESDALTGLLPRMTRLSATLSRGQLFEHATAAAGLALDRPAVTILLVLHMADRPLRVGEIAARMQVVGPHVTRQLQGLEREGLVERLADPDDQRARLITLTEPGRERISGYLRVVNGWFADALSDWSDEDQRDLVRLFGRMVDDLSAHLDAVVGKGGAAG
ncbi:MarR family winged helix-turn-helix transcriptional regulator [Actinoallomurus liliacearum]|uniref:MarR family winged helix-turn-helix transcriptional regulator n=1 Tax=Actinoallomurus liliacearum TaxID=1080073 RepID=A0ABP8TKM5_9ACTN